MRRMLTAAVMAVVVMGASATLARAQEAPVPLFTKVEQNGNTWRLYNANGEPLGRIWLAAHIDRILRDGDLAARIVNEVLPLSGSARRQAARAIWNEWQTAGGHSVDFSTLTLSLNNDAGFPDGNRHIYIAGNELGYLHGEDGPLAARLGRIVRLAEELWSGEQLGTLAQRNAALDGAIDRFRDAGGVQ